MLYYQLNNILLVMEKFNIKKKVEEEKQDEKDKKFVEGMLKRMKEKQYI